MARSLYKYDLFGKNIVEKLKKKGCLSEHTFKGVSGNKNIKGFAIDLEKMLSLFMANPKKTNC